MLLSHMMGSSRRTMHPKTISHSLSVPGVVVVVVVMVVYWKTLYIFHCGAERGVQCFKWHESKDIESDRSRDMFQHAYQANHIENGEYCCGLLVVSARSPHSVWIPVHLVTEGVKFNAATHFSLREVMQSVCKRWFHQSHLHPTKSDMKWMRGGEGRRVFSFASG